MAQEEFQELNAEVAELLQQVAATEAGEQSAIAVINGFEAHLEQRLTEVLTADKAADATSINAVLTELRAARGRFTASGGRLAESIAALGTQPAPPPAGGETQIP